MSADSPTSLRKRLTANIAFLFPDLPFLDRIDAAKAAGFDKVECHFPYHFPVELLQQRLSRAGVEMTGLNTAPGDVAAGEWGMAAAPGREAEFERDFDQALHYARSLEARVIHVMAAVVADGERERARATYVRNLRKAADKAEPHGIKLLLEPLNVRDKPGYLVTRSDDIAGIIEEIGAPNVKLLFDIYHVQIMEGDLTTRLRRHAPIIGHVQLAAVPSRAEPDEGEVNPGHVFEVLQEIGYDGLIGLEYKPRGDTSAGLAWIDKFIRSRSH
ncbi:TIM barrel protein [Phyllobacterium sp. SB3]|uniref:hydroxypyruvate isomerase family protein n=1 Tax=Phyllobacterium sp. SB3 TaxID=3156073 RepID=UPI0032AFF80C